MNPAMMAVSRRDCGARNEEVFRSDTAISLRHRLGFLRSRRHAEGADLLRVPTFLKDLWVEEHRAVAHVGLVGVDVFRQVRLVTIAGFF